MEAPVARLDLAALGQLSFEAPDEKRFPSLRLARNSLQIGGGAPTILNAANEAAVTAFLGGQIGFLDIPRVVEGALDRMNNGRGVAALTALEDVFALDSQAREQAMRLMSA
jgi:1-deoxy-D-xylulose-5-phosphate reductoisomerase